MKKLGVLILTVLSVCALSACARRETSLALPDGETVSVSVNYAALDKKNGGFENNYLRLLNTKNDCRQAFEALFPGLYEELETAAGKHAEAPKDADAVFDSDKGFAYLKDCAGSEPDMREICIAAARALDGGTALEFCYKTVEAQTKLEDIISKTALMCSFSTDYRTSGAARRNNIELAASKLDGLKISPGGYLSFNSEVGPRTVENGFQSAKIIVNGEFKNGVGGGVCQVSGTLFNAWLLSGLSVNLSRSHSLPVSYLPLGRDATVSASIDMILENDSSSDVWVSAKAREGVLTFEIFGQKSDSEIKIETSKIRDLEPPPPRRVGEGERLITSVEGKNGSIIKSWQCFYKDGELIAKKEIRDSYYAPRQGVEYYASSD